MFYFRRHRINWMPDKRHNATNTPGSGYSFRHCAWVRGDASLLRALSFSLSLSRWKMWSSRFLLSSRMHSFQHGYMDTSSLDYVIFHISFDGWWKQHSRYSSTAYEMLQEPKDMAKQYKYKTWTLPSKPTKNAQTQKKREKEKKPNKFIFFVG